MQTSVRHSTKVKLLTIFTIGLAGLQSYLLHKGTTDYGHKILSVYFYLELLIFTLTILTGLKNKIHKAIYLLIFIFETSIFFINERPISPDVLLMLIIGTIRVYVFYGFTKETLFK